MNLLIHSNELNRAMKLLGNVVEPRFPTHANVEFHADGKGLTLRATNGTMFASVMIPTIGLDDETFCVDGAMLKSVIASAGGEVRITTTERACILKSAGQTRMPIVAMDMPKEEPVSGASFRVNGELLARAIRKTQYAISTEQARAVLTGSLMETDGDVLKVVSLDGFQLALETCDVSGEPMKMIVPGIALRRVMENLCQDEKLTVTTDGVRVAFETETMRLSTVLLVGQFIDYEKLIQPSFEHSARVNVEEMLRVCRSSKVISSKNHLVKLHVREGGITLTSNSEQGSDFQADVVCDTRGGDLTIAFRDEYLMNALSAVDGEYAVMNMTSTTGPAVIEADGEGKHLLLPVRVS